MYTCSMLSEFMSCSRQAVYGERWTESYGQFSQLIVLLKPGHSHLLPCLSDCFWWPCLIEAHWWVGALTDDEI